MADKIDKWFQHEGLDRVHILLSHMDLALGYPDNPHPSIYNKRCKKLLGKVYKNLSQLYQEIGQWDEENAR